MAASLAVHLLSNSVVYEDWSHYNGGKSSLPSSSGEIIENRGSFVAGLSIPFLLGKQRGQNNFKAFSLTDLFKTSTAQSNNDKSRKRSIVMNNWLSGTEK